MKLSHLALKPFSFLYSQVIAQRNRMFNSGHIAAETLNVPVISVGNITMGGTGKTPVICHLLKWAEQNQIKAGVISRGYKRKSSHAAKVLPEMPEAALLYGDEPTMIARKFPEVPVYVASRRVEAGRKLLDENQVRVIFADDAFQHRQIKRDIDIVLLDAMESEDNYRLIPEGRAREPLKSLERAQFIIVTKVNLVSPEKRQEILGRLDKLGLQTPKIIECEYTLSAVVQRGKNPATDLKNKRVLLVSGVGHPPSFATMMALNCNVVGHIAYSDHHKYTERDAEKIVQLASEKQADYVVCTEKDIVKLAKLPKMQTLLWVAQLEPKMSLRVKELYDAITLLVR